MLHLSPKFKLYDFGKGSYGEVVRMIFAQANYPFEECLMDNFDEWHKQLKHVMPFRSLPVLEIDGRIRIAQITTICRALAWRFGLTCDDVNDDAKVDMLADAINEAILELRPRFLQIADDAQQIEQVHSAAENYDARAKRYLKKYLCPVFERFLQENPDRWLIGPRVTWADFMAASFFGKILRSANAPVLHRFSHICQHYERVLALPRIKEAMRVPDSQADVNQNFCKPLDLKIYCVNHY